MIKINKKAIKFYEKDFDKMINILIYNILRNDDKNITIVINNAHKEILQKKNK